MIQTSTLDTTAAVKFRLDSSYFTFHMCLYLNVM